MLIQELLQQLTEAESEKIEAYGVKGMKSTQWRKTFKNQAEFEKWLDKQDGNVEVQGTRKLDEDYDNSELVTTPGWFTVSKKDNTKHDGPHKDKARAERNAGDDDYVAYGQQEQSGRFVRFKALTAPVSEEQLDEKVFDEDKYTWYVWTQGKPSQSFERRGGSKQLTKGMQFGLRPATSKAGTWRLIMKQKGPSIIFSIDDATAKSVAKAALELI